MLKPIIEPKINFFVNPIVIDVATVAISAEPLAARICRYSFISILGIHRLDDLYTFHLVVFPAIGAFIDIHIG